MQKTLLLHWHIRYILAIAKLLTRMVYISLPPEQPVAVSLTAASIQEPMQAHSPAKLPDNRSSTLLDTLLAPSPPISVQPSVAALLAQQTEDNLPVLPSSPSENRPEGIEPTEASRFEEESFEIEGLPEGADIPRPDNSLELDDLQTDDLQTGEMEAFASQLQLSADVQEFDPIAQTVTARGNVVLRLNDAIIETNELWVNLANRYALAEGDVLLTRGAQLVRGRRLEYNFIQQSGVVGDAIGTLYLPAIDEDLSSPLAGVSASRRAYDPINRNPDLQVGNDGNLLYGTRLSTQPSRRNNGFDDADNNGFDDDDNQSSDTLLNQLRFETDELTFDVEGWRADDVRITNDPFSPPELELRADGLVLRNISTTQDELLLRRPRLVFDQGFSVPLLRSRIVLSRGGINPDDLNPVPAPIGIDGGDRGGLYIGSKIPLITNDKVRLSVTPQFFIGRAFSGENNSPIAAQNFGATTELRAQLSPSTTLRGSIDITSFDLPEITENIRATLRAEQQLGGHRLSLQYSYRERLFNGSLGFQNVQTSLGAVLLSPDIKLGKTGLRLTYQASAQLINAESDIQPLLAARESTTGRITATRYQGSAALRRTFNLWRGEPKRPTQAEGLRFTAQPVVPSVNLNTGIRTVLTSYSTGDAQNSLLADINVDAQFGHLIRNFGDYTRFNVGYSQSFIGEASSPFLFDREVDRNVLSLGIVQQVYGPFLAGFQTAISVDEGEPINTIYSLEYSRRTYGLLLRYDTTQNTGSIGFRLSNFRWIGDTNPFDTPRIRRVQGGVIEAR